MLRLQTIPLVLYILAGGLLGLISWGFIRARTNEARTNKDNNLWSNTRNDPLVWLLVLAVFTTGAFIVYVLFALPS